MAQTVESQYKELLNPVKDPQKSFEINIAELLEDYIANLYEGKFAPNFNSAALLLQGSASIYVKKVEYLHDLATQLYNRLIKQKTDEQQKQQQQPQQQSKKEQKEKKKEEVLDDPFAPVEIKLGKNLSCFKRKSTKILLKNNDKKDKVNSIPVYLLSVDGDDNGGPFHDVRGEVIGNKGDYALNKCFITPEGFLVLPTVSLKLVPSPDTTPDYYNDSDLFERIATDGAGTPVFSENMDDDDIHMSPDDGIGASYPESNTVPESTPGTDVNSQATDTPSQGTTIPSTDEGIGSTPVDDIHSCLSSGNTEGNENVPTGNAESSDPALMPVRHSIRQALKQCQLAQEDDPLGSTTDKNLLVRKKIQKKNTRSLPSKLRMPGEVGETISISEYCARTFFSMDSKNLKNSLLAFDVSSFDQNSKFMKRIIEKIDALKSSNRRNKKVDPIEDEKEIDVEGIECLKATDEGDDGLCVPFDDGDVRIDNDPVIPEPENNAGPPIEDAPAEVPIPEISHIAQEECQNYLREVHQFVQNSDITERVHEWEKNVKPFLDQMDKRESFDINLYGSRILNAFEDNNRKQTMTFRQFCQNKEKWEIHRYFMALLPLANIGNVSIESEPKGDGTEEIFVTLLSRKMHHKELEEFGHSDGSHS